MDVTKDVSMCLEVLGLVSLTDVALADLQHRVRGIQQAEIPPNAILRTYFTWLVKRLQAIDNSDEQAFTIELSAWCRALDVSDFSMQDIAEELEHWRLEQAEQEPASIRRLNLGVLEIRHFLDNNSTATPEPNRCADNEIRSPPVGLAAGNSFNGDAKIAHASYGHMHPDRVQLSNGEINPPEQSRFGADSGHGTDEDGDDTSAQRFLTGSNRMFFEDDLKARIAMRESKMQSKSSNATRGFSGRQAKSCGQLPKQAPKKVSVEPKSQNAKAEPKSTHKKAEPTRDKAQLEKPSGRYICKRCGGTDHFLSDCPTNLDPNMDTKPNMDYECGLCRKKGDHWVTLCPKNEEPSSLTMRRKAARMAPTKSDYYRPSRHESERAGRHDHGSARVRDLQTRTNESARSRKISRWAPDHRCNDDRSRSPRSRSPMSSPTRNARSRGRILQRAQSRDRSRSPMWISRKTTGESLQRQAAQGLELHHDTNTRGEYLSLLQRSSVAGEGRLSYWDNHFQGMSPPAIHGSNGRKIAVPRTSFSEGEPPFQRQDVGPSMSSPADAEGFLASLANDIVSSPAKQSKIIAEGEGVVLDTMRIDAEPAPYLEMDLVRSSPANWDTSNHVPTKPQYHPQVTKLFATRSLVKLNRAKRATAHDLWDLSFRSTLP